MSAATRGFLPSRTLAMLIGLGICNHVLLAGARVAVSLDALSRGASAAVVGVLMALFALLPMIFAIPAGRLADRIGARRPMAWGSAGCAVAALLPALWPGLPALFAASMLAGFSFMLFQVPSQRAVGDLGAPAARAVNFSWYALGFSVSGFAGPLVAGIAIDRLGFRWAFAVLAVLPAVAALVVARRRLALPAARAHDEEVRTSGMFDLLRYPMLRRVLALNALFALGWDLHTVFVPIYGSRIGLSASEIGVILSSFAAATFVVRFAIPWVGRGWQPMVVLRIALLVSAAVYIAFPFTSSTLALIVLSFVLGLGLGIGQPMVLSLLHEHAPAGRMGETVGLRMSLIQSMSVTVPLVFGALGTTVGLLPVFGSVGLFLGLGGIAARFRR
ncbi:MAG TPA: MFS transporter [Casimicrobiaceae bacterium]|nr:MFS transporter [Casimicrobiaceae bacterium]